MSPSLVRLGRHQDRGRERDNILIRSPFLKMVRRPPRVSNASRSVITALGEATHLGGRVICCCREAAKKQYFAGTDQFAENAS